ncbi:GNAT family protein [Kineococcus endophyticus]|uniref:GNAT family protein n=1 Tax=Kineococcus endophyticus TaxID=1181883 RepID=A0ABV3PA22_9ACTN
MTTPPATRLGGFTLPVGDGLDLVLAEPRLAAPLHSLLLANLEHLQPWDELARPDLTLEEFRGVQVRACQAWVEGRGVPCVLRLDGRVVGALGSRTVADGTTAELGFWVDAAHQGRGLVSRSVRALVRHLAVDHGIRTVEMRIAAGNVRSRAVADRLGFALVQTVPGVLTIDGRPHDLCVHRRPALGD